MKKLLTVFVIFVYFVPISLILTVYIIAKQTSQNSLMLGAFAIPIIFMIAVCILIILNIIKAIISIVQSRCLSFRTVMVYKLCLIPFYIINFIFWSIASMVFHIAIIVWPLIPFVIIYTYFTIFGTSIHIIAKLFNLKQNKVITTKQFVLHCILQFIFTFDVIDSIYLAIRQKKFEHVS